MSLHLPGQIHVGPTADDLYDDLAECLMANAIAAADERGHFHLALSGGATPIPFYRRLILDPRFRVIPWTVTHLWIVDERCVPLTDKQSNFRMIREVLADHLPTPMGQIHQMKAMSQGAADEYEDELRRYLNEKDGPDFVLLGMGHDGHTAGLFPRSPALGEASRWVVGNEGPTVMPPSRLTMTYPVLNAAGHLAVLVTGPGKSAVVQQLGEHLRQFGPDPQELPITGINPVDGQLTWFLDAAAAGA